jgi:hypothetical protein
MIYFIRAGRKRLVKIGYSKGHPSARMAVLQTGSVEPLSLIGMLDGEPRDEAQWHRRFKHLRVTGEWFRWTSELSRAARPHLRSTAMRRLAKIEKENEEIRAILRSNPSLEGQ